MTRIVRVKKLGPDRAQITTFGGGSALSSALPLEGGLLPESVVKALAESPDVFCATDDAAQKPAPQSLRLATERERDLELARLQQSKQKKQVGWSQKPFTGGQHQPAAAGGSRSASADTRSTRSPMPTTQPPKAADGLPRFSNNPYNFAEWDGQGPWLDTEVVTHERWYPGRLSGVLDVTLEAAGLVFVPAGTTARRDTQGGDTRQESRPFWSCGTLADGRPRYGIPGSSIKGTVRTLFETWTNSRLTVLSEDANDPGKDSYHRPIPYRRASAKAWIVDQSTSAKVSVRDCEVHFVDRATGMKPGNRPLSAEIHPIPVTAVNPADTVSWQAVPYRANLLWTPNHLHGTGLPITHLVVKVSPNGFPVEADALRRFRDNLEHRAYAEHPARASALPTAGTAAPAGAGGRGAENFYSSITNNSVDGVPITARLDEMRALAPGTVLFGMAPNGELLCFGHNVYFLWPSLSSPKDLVRDFWPRGEDATRTGADHAETAFGFAGSYSSKGEPFRGRVRFTTFWANPEAEPAGAHQMPPLTAPSGVKLKARPLYLPPREGLDLPPEERGLAQSYDEATSLRGRKLYWHQSAREANTIERADQSSQLPPPIHPMPAGTTFSGHVHFDNMTKEELGALVVSLAPGYYWDAVGKAPEESFGIKIGKGKPRGLGSMRARAVKLRLRSVPARESWASFVGKPLAEREGLAAEDVVKAFREWLVQRAKAAGKESPSALSFVQDLHKLLSLRSLNRSREYHGKPAEYSWMPRVGAPGDTAGNKIQDGSIKRPLAMPRARDL